MSNKVIYHIDIDSFFVSVERTKNPQLHNLPIVIARDHKRAIVVTASYEARALGIKTGMPLYQAKKLVPNLKAISPNMNLYNQMSSQIFDYIAETNLPMQVYSIDECFLDITSYTKKEANLKFLAKKLQKDILRIFNIPISIGIGHNLFNAKMSTALNKPFGITLTKPWEFAKHFHNLEITKFFGIGKGLEKVFAEAKVKTIGDFCTNKNLFPYFKSHFGVRFQELLNNCHGLSSDFVDDNYNRLKGIGNSLTFIGPDLNEYAEIIKEIKKLLDKSWKRLHNRALIASNLTISLRLKSRKWVSTQKQYKEAILSKEEALQEFIKIFQNFWDLQPLRGVGIRFSKLVNKYHYQQNERLFATNRFLLEKAQRSLILELNRKFTNQPFLTLKELEENQSRNKKQSRYLMRDHIFKVDGD